MANASAVAERVVVLTVRCRPCSKERIDGKPCNFKTCLCNCHKVKK
jgi:hypothetical protein